MIIGEVDYLFALDNQFFGILVEQPVAAVHRVYRTVLGHIPDTGAEVGGIKQRGRILILRNTPASGWSIRIVIGYLKPPAVRAELVCYFQHLFGGVVAGIIAGQPIADCFAPTAVIAGTRR
jgi:hypothetical protein